MATASTYRLLAVGLLLSSVLIGGIGVAIRDEPTYVGCAQGDMHCEIEEQYIKHDNSDSQSLYLFAGLVFLSSFVPLVISDRLSL